MSTCTTLCTKTVHPNIYQEAHRYQSNKSIFPFLAQVTIIDTSNACYPQHSSGPNNQTLVWQCICPSGTTLHFFLYFVFLHWGLPDQVMILFLLGFFMPSSTLLLLKFFQAMRQSTSRIYTNVKD